VEINFPEGKKKKRSQTRISGFEWDNSNRSAGRGPKLKKRGKRRESKPNHFDRVFCVSAIDTKAEAVIRTAKIKLCERDRKDPRKKKKELSVRDRTSHGAGPMVWTHVENEEKSSKKETSAGEEEFKKRDGEVDGTGGKD